MDPNCCAVAVYNFYQDGHQDQCFNNTFILGGPRLAPTNVSSAQWADLRGCEPSGKPNCAMAQNPYGGGASPIMIVRHNTVYNHNESAVRRWNLTSICQPGCFFHECKLCFSSAAKMFYAFFVAWV